MASQYGGGEMPDIDPQALSRALREIQNQAQQSRSGDLARGLSDPSTAAVSPTNAAPSAVSPTNELPPPQLPFPTDPSRSAAVSPTNEMPPQLPFPTDPPRGAQGPAAALPDFSTEPEEAGRQAADYADSVVSGAAPGAPQIESYEPYDLSALGKLKETGLDEVGGALQQGESAALMKLLERYKRF